MSRAHLKNIIILILLLANLFLAGAILVRHSAALSAADRAAAELTELLERQEISLDTDLPADLPPAGRTLTRSSDSDTALARALLGEEIELSNEGGGILSYTGASAQALFRSNGSFEVTGRLSDGDAEDTCQSFCRTFGYEGLALSLTDGSGSGSAVQYFEGYPVVNASVTFLVESDCLISVSGTHLPADTAAAGTAEAESGSMTAITALSRFLEDRRASGAVATSITDIYLCYQLQSTASASMALFPAWCVVTDTGDCYVNCATGAVTHR